MSIAPKVIVKPFSKVADLIENNHLILLMLQHFNIDFRVGEATVSQLCERYDISENLFMGVANLYNGFSSIKGEAFSKEELLQVIDFLKNTHIYYRSDKYPQISYYINQLKQNNKDKELEMLENFFDEYFIEVIEHLDYEDNVAFPYFIALLNGAKNNSAFAHYSSDEYSDHHTDIEVKLKDLKSLLLKHLKINGDLDLRRRLFFALYELEFDLYIHSQIEETILIPSGVCIENE